MIQDTFKTGTKLNVSAERDQKSGENIHVAAQEIRQKIRALAEDISQHCKPPFTGEKWGDYQHELACQIMTLLDAMPELPNSSTAPPARPAD